MEEHMNNKTKSICLLSLLCLFLSHTAFSEEEITVRLATEDSKLIPIFIPPISGENSDFPASYLEDLRSVFTFDMNANGMTEVLREGSVASISPSEMQYGSTCDLAAWKGAEVYYLIKMKMDGKNLSAKIISINAGSSKLIDGIVVTGDLASDRRIIHRLSDSIHLLLFQKPGIASHTILYSFRAAHPRVKEHDEQWVSEIYEADYDGANARALTHENSYCITPIWAKPASQSAVGALLYTSYKIGQPKIYYASAKDGKSRRLATLRGNQLTPEVSADGTKIAFSCDAQGLADIFIIPFHPTTGALGKPRQVYTAKGTTSASPSFSPDGARIVFVANKDGSPKIYMLDIPKESINPKDLHPALISKRCRENSSPAWSPDGKKIAYAARQDGARQIWIYDCESGLERPLTDGSGDKENPKWAPNSLHLIFNSTDKNGKTELYLINLNQKKAVKITSGPGEKRFPYWK